MSTLVGHLCRLREKGRKRGDIVEEMKERDREERGTGMKVNRRNKNIPPSSLTGYMNSRLNRKPVSLGRFSAVRYTTHSPQLTIPYGKVEVILFVVKLSNEFFVLDIEV